MNLPRQYPILSADLFGQLTRYAVVGGAGTIFYMALVIALVEVFLVHPVASAIIAFILTDALIYLLNRSWVFASRARHGYAFPRFIAVSVIALVLNAAIMHLTVSLGLWYALGLVGATAIVPPTNYLLNAYWCFK